MMEQDRVMKFDWIEPGVLAASSIPLKVQDLQSLRKNGIRAIVSLTEHPLTTFSDVTLQVFDELEITYLHSPIPDGYPPDLAQARKILRFIDQMKAQGRATFIHCHAGVGRTGTVLHMYYLAQGLSLEEAKEQVRSRRLQCILLSDHQEAFLRDFTVANKSEKSVDWQSHEDKGERQGRAAL